MCVDLARLARRLATLAWPERPVVGDNLRLNMYIHLSRDSWQELRRESKGNWNDASMDKMGFNSGWGHGSVCRLADGATYDTRG
jgi:hypothetical protein